MIACGPNGKDQASARAAWNTRTPPPSTDTELAVVPIPMMLFCPRCGNQHIDEPDERTPDWDNPPHRSHLCHDCGCIWRPADVATVGVDSIHSAGKADNWPTNSPDAKAALLATSANDPSNGEAVERLREALQTGRDYVSGVVAGGLAYIDGTDIKAMAREDLERIDAALSTPAPNPDPLVGELVAALEPFAKRADGYESESGQHDFADDHVVLDGFGTVLPEITVEHFRNARTALASHNSSKIADEIEREENEANGQFGAGS